MPWKWVCGRRDCGWSVDSDVFYRHGMASNQRNYLEPFPWELPFVLDFEACWLSCILSSFSPLCSSACVCVGIPFVCWLCIHIWCDPVFVFFLFGLRSPNEINNRMPRMPVWCASSNPIRLFLLLVSFLTKRKNKKTFLFILNSRTKAQRGGFRSFSKWERHSEHHRPQKWRLFSPNFFIYRGVLTSCWWAMSSSYDLAHDWMGNPWLCFEDRESVR